MTDWLPELAGRTGPRYRAIADALADDVASGRLPAGSRLPTHRDLAFRLGVTVGTVTRAYAEAEKRGLIGGEVGRGTFVQGHRLNPASTPALAWVTGDEAAGQAGQAAAVQGASDQEMVGRAPPLIDMTSIQLKSSELFQALGPTLNAIAANCDPESLLAYGPHAGRMPHREAGAQWLARHHRVEATAESVIITTGAQNAMAVALAAAARPGDVVLTERLTNYGLKTLCATQGYYLEGVAMDEHGLMPDAFESACRRLGPKVLYFVPTLQNPTASVMPQARRAEIAEIARRYKVVIIEDDVFGFMVPDAKPLQRIAPDITLHVSSLSKSVAPGLRIGYVVAPPNLRPRVEAAVRALQYSTPGIAAELASRWITDGVADRIVESQHVENLARQVLARQILPTEIVQGYPNGQHLWLVLPEPWRRDDFVAEARQRGVSVTGADVFAVGRISAPHAVRVSLCMPKTREEVARGLRILVDALDAPSTALSIV